MNRPFARHRFARVIPAILAAGGALAPLPGRAAAGEPVDTLSVAELFLVLGVGLAAGLTVWLFSWRSQRRLARRADSRIREMTALIEHADCLLWEAEVVLSPQNWVWRMTLHSSAFCRKLFGSVPQTPGVDLWQHYQIENRSEMDRRAREAMEGGKPGYTQEFRAIRGGQTWWLHENVSIARLGSDRYWLVGLVTDITPQREAEAARRQSELTVDSILAHADCLLWRATVVREANGLLNWVYFEVPNSQFSEVLFGDRVYRKESGFWSSLEMPDQEAMNRLSSDSILTGAPGYEQQFRATTKEGRTFWLNERVSITRVEENRWSLVGAITDNTAQHEAEEARRRSEARLSHLLERADAMIWQAQVTRDPAGNFLWDMFVPRSQLYRRIFNADPTNPVGFAWHHRGVPEHAEMGERAFKAISAGAPGYEQVFHVPRHDGDIWLNENVSISATGPEAWELVGVISDITAKHNAEEAWRATEDRLGRLLELADCMVWDATVTLGDNDVPRWDLYTPRSVLYHRIFSDLEGAGLPWHMLEIPEFDEMCQRTLDALKGDAGGYTQEFHVVRPEGDIWLREVVRIMRLSPGLFRLVGVITDISQQRRAEMAHALSRARLEQLLDKSDCMVWEAKVERVVADKFEWTMYTPRSRLFRRLFEQDPENERGIDWASANIPEFPEMEERARQAMVGGRPGYEQVFHMVKPAGDIWLNERVTIKSLAPDRWELVGIITDITVQRMAEAARHASEARLDELLARADCLLWEAKVELREKDWSWSFNIQPSGLARKIFDAPQPPGLSGLWDSLTIPERLSMDQTCRVALAEGRPSYEQVFQIIRGKGSAIWISESVTIRPLGQGLFSLVGVAVDITPQRGAEEALAAEKERLSVTLRAMHESVVTTDTSGRIQFMNPAAAELSGWSAQECTGRPVEEIFPLENSRTDQSVPVPYARVAHGDVVADLPSHTRLVTRSGRKRQVEGCCAPIHAVDSKVIGTVFVIRDVTEQERLEQELVRATRLESVGVLAGGIAHDFNNILTAVMGNLALAQLDVPPDSPAASTLRSAEKAALRARDLTQQLLTFAKGGEPVRAAVQLDSIVREMAAFALHGSRVKAHYDMAPDLWPADADKGQIGRVVQNLVINAVQAMPNGGSLRIVIRNDPVDGLSLPGLAPGNYIQIAISDTGEGIAPENLARIFDPYFTTKQTGTGLGLAAVYSIIKKHRGHIEVDSQVGQGTTFRIWLPALRDSQASADTRMPWAGGTPERMKGRILFMDDEEIIRDMAAGLLRRFGLTVDCAMDGAEAVEKYRTAFSAGSRYDLVIMDLTVPGGMGGLAALGKLKEIDPRVKAVVSSGYSSDPVLANYRAHGFVAVVAKPYETHEISRMLREVLALP